MIGVMHELYYVVSYIYISIITEMSIMFEV